MPFTDNRFFEQACSQVRDLHVFELGHDGKLLVQVGFDQRPYFFSSNAHAVLFIGGRAVMSIA